MRLWLGGWEKTRGFASVRSSPARPSSAYEWRGSLHMDTMHGRELSLAEEGEGADSHGLIL